MVMYSIIDVETTGGRALDHQITEIAIINFDGHKIQETFTSLVNPERPIPYGITHLTGIDDSMVSNAPKFYEIAKKVIEMTEGRTVVAHNAHFDLSFLKREFQDLGYDYRRMKRCTVRLARQAFPRHPSYSLGKICARLGIEINGRHRALGDAQATTELFARILKRVEVKEEEHNIAWPPHFDRQALDKVPESMGVYQLWDKDGELLYVGRSQNMRKRVLEHLRVTEPTRAQMEFKNSIAHVTSQETGSELIAALLENHLIKINRPPFNQALNRVRFRWAVVAQTLSDGRTGLLVKQHQAQDQVLMLFSGRKSAERFIERIYQTAYGFLPLSPEIAPLGLPLEDAEKKLWNTLKKHIWSGGHYALITKGRHELEKGVVVVRDDKIEGYAFVRDDEDFQELGISPLSNDRDSQVILMQAMSKGKMKRYPLPRREEFENSL